MTSKRYNKQISLNNMDIVNKVESYKGGGNKCRLQKKTYSPEKTLQTNCWMKLIELIC